MNGEEEPNRDTDPQAACQIEAEPHAARLENQPEPGTDEIEVRARGASRVALPRLCERVAVHAIGGAADAADLI